MNKGCLFLIPTLLGSEKWEHVIPIDVLEITKKTRFFAVENIKTARRYLRRIDSCFPIDDTTFFLLNKHTSSVELPTMLSPIKQGFDVGIISEAGCPGVADPGADLVALAHKQNVLVCPLTGPSSFLLALMGSGFNGQSFCFHGYVPKERKNRIEAVKKFENEAYRTGQTQIFMDTPFRNNHLFEDILNECSEFTYLCIASNLTLPTEKIKTKKISEWQKKMPDLNKKPTVFLIGKY